MNAKSEEKQIRLLAQRCGLRLEEACNPAQFGYTYVLWNGDGKGIGADDPAQIEAYLRKTYPCRMPRQMRNWDDILVEAKAIVESYDTAVTLRQLFYQLVSRQIIENKQHRYDYLSWRTAAARREGLFPDLICASRFQRSFEPPAHVLIHTAQLLSGWRVRLSTVAGVRIVLRIALRIV